VPWGRKDLTKTIDPWHITPVANVNRSEILRAGFFHIGIQRQARFILSDKKTMHRTGDAVCLSQSARA
jgi:hypothetical protein